MSKSRKPYVEMNAQELFAATRKYDTPFGGWEEFKPLTAQDKRLHQQARRRGRPKVGRGAKRVMVTVELGLLKQADAHAKRLGLTRSEFIANGIRSMLSKKVPESNSRRF